MKFYKFCAYDRSSSMVNIPENLHQHELVPMGNGSIRLTVPPSVYQVIGREYYDTECEAYGIYKDALESERPYNNQTLQSLLAQCPMKTDIYTFHRRTMVEMPREGVTSFNITFEYHEAAPRQTRHHVTHTLEHV